MKTLIPGQSISDLKKAKIYSMATGHMLHNTSRPNEPVDESNPAHLDISHSLPHGHPARKKPMLIVGQSAWQRKEMPEHQATHDTHLMFIPNSTPAWHVGAVTVDRKTGGAQFHQAKHHDIHQAFKQLHETVKQNLKERLDHQYGAERQAHLTHSIYRMPKISLKDILQLEPYKQADVEEYQKDSPGYVHPSLPAPKAKPPVVKSYKQGDPIGTIKKDEYL